MPEIAPGTRPKQSREETEEFLRKNGITDGFGLLGVRGYYKRTMGDPAKNDRGIYDDAIMLLSPTAYVTFNANCDPSIFRFRIATLQPGVWRYKIGIHNLSKAKSRQYVALVQAAKVAVSRDGAGEETGYFGINIHRGGKNTTSSEGCQTIQPLQWEAFIALVRQQMKQYGKRDIPYVLISNS